MGDGALSALSAEIYVNAAIGIEGLYLPLISHFTAVISLAVNFVQCLKHNAHFQVHQLPPYLIAGDRII